MQQYVNLDDSILSDEQRSLRAQIRRFVENEIAPVAAEWEKQGRVPADMFLRLGELGYLGLAFPTEYGGSGMDTLASVILNEELARSTYGGLTASITVHSDMTALHLVRAGSETQRQRFLPDIISGRKICALGVSEPRGGSDLVRMASVGRREGNSYVLNGTKLFITNANIAEVFFVVVRTDSDSRGGNGFSLFLLERGMPGLSNGQRFQKTGWHSSDTGELRLEDCRVPSANLIGEEGRGFYYMMAGLDHERICAAAQAMGLAEAGIRLTLEWVRARQAYGKTLWDLQVIRQELARLVTELCAARALVYLAAAKAARGESVQLEGAMLKAHVPELANRVLYKCVQYHGGMGYMSETPVERLARDARILSIGGGAAEVMYDEVAKRL